MNLKFETKESWSIVDFGDGGSTTKNDPTNLGMGRLRVKSSVVPKFLLDIFLKDTEERKDCKGELQSERSPGFEIGHFDGERHTRGVWSITQVPFRPIYTVQMKNESS